MELLTPDQVSQIWMGLRPKVLETLRPEMRREDVLTALLGACVSGHAQLWRGVGDDFEVYCLTAIEYETFTATRRLLIYLLFSLRGNVPEDFWNRGIDALERFAQKMMCKYICAYTWQPKIAELFERVGGSKTTFLYKVIS